MGFESDEIEDALTWLDGLAQGAQAATHEQSPRGMRVYSDDERELVIDETSDNERDFERLLRMDEEWPDHFEEQSRPSRNRLDEVEQRQHDAMSNMADRPQSLHDYLHDQLGWFELDPTLRAMCDRIIYNLDPNGRLQSSLDDLLGADATDADLALAQQALALVQRLDPPGIGARDVRECLLLQLAPGMPHYEELRNLISNHLEDLEHNRLPLISKKTGYSIALIQEVVQEMRALKVNPGAEFNNALVPTVTPDIFVEQTDSGQTSRPQPVCVTPGVPVNSTQPDRRVLSVAVVNCVAEGVQGQTTGVTVNKWIDVFLVEPSVPRTRTEASDVYVEVIGETKLGGGGSTAAQQIRRDVPYLVR